MISKLVSDHKSELEELQILVDETSIKANQTQAFLNLEIEQLKNWNKDLEFTSKQYEAYIQRLKAFIEEMSLRAEEETKLRSKFESKLNVLLSVIWDQDERYSRAVVDVKDLLEERDRILKLYDEMVDDWEKSKTEQLSLFEKI